MQWRRRDRHKSPSQAGHDRLIIVPSPKTYFIIIFYPVKMMDQTDNTFIMIIITNIQASHQAILHYTHIHYEMSLLVFIDTLVNGIIYT